MRPPPPHWQKHNLSSGVKKLMDLITYSTMCGKGVSNRSFRANPIRLTCLCRSCLHRCLAWAHSRPLTRQRSPPFAAQCTSTPPHYILTIKMDQNDVKCRLIHFQGYFLTFRRVGGGSGPSSSLASSPSPASFLLRFADKPAPRSLRLKIVRLLLSGEHRFA